MTVPRIFLSSALSATAVSLLRPGLVETDVRVELLSWFRYPAPVLPLGLALRNIATSAIDVSDGLLADLGHILEESKMAAVVHEERLPADALRLGIDATIARDCLLAGGDAGYEQTLHFKVTPD